MYPTKTSLRAICPCLIASPFSCFFYIFFFVLYHDPHTTTGVDASDLVLVVRE